MTDPETIRMECEAVAAIMRRLYALRLTTTSGGNVSLRLPGDLMAITPGGGDKSQTRAEEIVILALDGTLRTAGRKPSSEYPMHLRIYAECPGAQAIVHAHPPLATAFTAAQTPIDTDLTGEGWVIAGRPVMVPYALGGTMALADAVAAAARAGAHCLLLQNHGVTCVGTTLLEAFNRLEVLEHAAQHTLAVRQLAGVRHLSTDELNQLDDLYGKPRRAGE